MSKDPKASGGHGGVVLGSLAFIAIVGSFYILTSPAWSMNSLLDDKAKRIVSIRTPADVASWLFHWDWSEFVEEHPPDDGRFTDTERRPGVGPYNCTSDDIELQATTWRRMTSASDTRWQIHCAGGNVSRALHLSSPGRLGKVFVDIGANKGYVLASWMSTWAPELGISARTLGPYWRDTVKVEHPCGPCKDCEESVADADVTYAERGPGNPLGLPSDVRLFGFEASPGTYRALAAAPAWAAAQGVVRIENLAGDAAPGTLMFPNSCGTASEICAPDATKGAGDATAVPATSVDAWRAANDVGRIFWLAIDTEGNDPAVLRGAEATLAEGEVVVVQFEYNGERGLWKDPNVLLQPIVGHLDELGFTCFLESSVQLFLLSRCWSPAYEWKTWSNVICVNRDYGGQLDALLRMTALWGRVVARGSGTALGQQHPGMRS